MKRTKRLKNYEVTKDGKIHVYPSIEKREGGRMYGEIRSALECAAKNLMSLIRGKERLGSLK